MGSFQEKTMKLAVKFLLLLIGSAWSSEEVDERSTYCDGCVAVEISSEGTGQVDIPQLRGRYNYRGVLFGDSLPFYQFDGPEEMYLTLDPESNPTRFYVKWVVSEDISGLFSVLQNDKYNDGIYCPWDIPDGWSYSMGDQWIVDDTIQVECIANYES